LYSSSSWRGGYKKEKKPANEGLALAKRPVSEFPNRLGIS
jgi:hypothetical protein